MGAIGDNEIQIVSINASIPNSNKLFYVELSDEYSSIDENDSSGIQCFSWDFYADWFESCQACICMDLLVSGNAYSVKNLKKVIYSPSSSSERDGTGAKINGDTLAYDRSRNKKGNPASNDAETPLLLEFQGFRGTLSSDFSAVSSQESQRKYQETVDEITKELNASQEASLNGTNSYNMSLLPPAQPIHAFSPRFQGMCPLGEQEVIIFPEDDVMQAYI